MLSLRLLLWCHLPCSPTLQQFRSGSMLHEQKQQLVPQPCLGQLGQPCCHGRQAWLVLECRWLLALLLLQ